MKPTLKTLCSVYGVKSPSAIEFENFSKYIACSKKYKKYNAATLRVNSIFISARMTSKLPKKYLEPLMNENFVPKNSKNYEVNVESMIEKTIKPKIVPIALCLSTELTGKNIRAGNNGLDDELNPYTPILDEINELTNDAQKELENEAIKFKEDFQSIEIYVNDYLDKIMKTIIHEDYYNLFMNLDMFQKFIFNTKFVQRYKDWRDLYDCVSKNCKEYGQNTPDDYFLFFFEEKTQFILPIDYNNGKLRINKFFQELTSDQLLQGRRIELLYYDYLKIREEIINKSYNVIKDSGVPDINNPYYILLEKSRANLIMNTLF